MFNVDSHFEIGSSHKVCEDFAIHGSFESPSGEILYYGIVADGCSSSMTQNGVRLPINVDTGARLLALIAKQAIKEIVPTLKEIDENLHHALRNSILQKMDILLRQLGLPIPAIDCTLLINLVYGDQCLWVVWGDGIIVNNGSKNTIIEIVEFESGAPYYLSYALDKKRNELYAQKFGGQKKIVRRIIIGEKDGIVVHENKYKYDEPFFAICSFSGGIENGALKFSIISDGAQSFQQVIEGQYEKRILPPEEALQKLINPKSMKGNFIGRVMNGLHRWEKKEGIDHYDDLAIASIVEIPISKGEEDASSE